MLGWCRAELLFLALCPPSAGALRTWLAAPRTHVASNPAWSATSTAALAEPVAGLVERFDRRGTEPFELLIPEFGHNSVRIKEILLIRIYPKFKNVEHFLEYSA